MKKAPRRGHRTIQDLCPFDLYQAFLDYGYVTVEPFYGTTTRGSGLSRLINGFADLGVQKVQPIRNQFLIVKGGLLITTWRLLIYAARGKIRRNKIDTPMNTTKQHFN